jgi:tetratricopeptide (TPR) repeat protein
MHARWIRASVFLVPGLFLSALAGAQSVAVLGRHDAAFANLLHKELGYTDLAERLVATIEKQPTLDPDEQIGVKALHLDVRLDLAVRERDVLKRKDLLRAILEEKQEFARQYQGRKEAEEVTNTLPDVYRQLGETITAAVQKEKDPALIAKLQQEGSAIYRDAQDRLLKRIEELRTSLAEKDDAQTTDALATALYNLPRTYYFHSLLYPEGEFKKKDLLEKAIKGFEELGLDFGDRALNYEGMIFMGLAYKDMKNSEEALEVFGDVTGIPEEFQYEKNQRGEYELDRLTADIISSATLQKTLYQTELKDYAGAIETAKHFLDTILGATETRSGLAVLAAKGDAHIALGDAKGASEVAEKLVAEDPSGPWGGKGREIQQRLLSSGGTVDADQVLKIAQAAAARNDFEGAIKVANKAIQAARGTPNEADVCIEAYVFIGAMFGQHLGQWNEASLAFDLAFERFGNNEKADRPVYEAMRAYTRLNREDKRAFYKKRLEERQKTLVTRFPTSPWAAAAQLAEGQELEDDKKFAEAAEFYAKIQPGSTMFMDAQFGAARCYYSIAREQFRDPNKASEAKTNASQAETLLRKVLTDAAKKRLETVDLAEQDKLDRIGFGSTKMLADLYLTKGVDRANDALTLLEGADEKYSSVANSAGDLWSMRIRALNDQGKLDEAISKLDALAKRDPDSKAVGPASRLIAIALDNRAEQLTTEKKEREAAEAQKRAAQYYAMAGRAMLKSPGSKVSDIEAIALRLLILGMQSNGVPEGEDLFVGWDPKNTRDPSLWQLSAELYESAFSLQPSYKTEIYLGRLYGFLGQYDQAANRLGTLFDKDPIWDAEKKKFDRRALTGRTELYFAYFEWGVAEHLFGVSSNDPDRMRRAQGILDALTRPQELEPNSRNWWYATYYRLKNMYELGNYNEADIAFNDLERRTQGLGAQYKLDGLFNRLKTDIRSKK